MVDASALLASIIGERGGAEVGDVLDGACLSAVNYSEVLTRLFDLELQRGVEDMTAMRNRLRYSITRLRVIPFDDAAARAVAAFRARKRHLGLSLGDRACLALGMIASAPILTADRRMAEAEIGLEIRLIR